MTLVFLLSLLFGQNSQTQAIEAHVRFLADDLLEGRETTYPGQKIAARYIAGQYEAGGVQSFYPDEEDPYYHTFNMYKARVHPDETVVKFGDNSITLDDDFEFNEFHPKEGTLSEEVVFLGYAYRSKKHKYNAFEDVKGKIVVAVDGYPAHLSAKFKDTTRRREHLLDRQGKWARKAGAKALILIPGPDLERPDRRPEITTSNLFGRRMSTTPPKLVGNDFSVVMLKSGSAARLFGSEFAQMKAHLKALDETQQPATMAFKSPLTIETVFEELALPTENVVGYVPGTDPKLKDEYVVISAHYDHIGKKGDDIFNGADDNASGTALLMELGRTIAEKPTRRSIVFLALTAEEKGLIGSRKFLESSPIPVESIVANINLDMLGRNETTSMGLIPAKNEDVSTLNTMTKEVNQKLKEPFTFIEDFDQYHHRSDHYNFAKRNIPALFFFAGDHEDYHKATDTWDKVNYEKIYRTGQLLELLLTKVGNSPETPRFLKPRAQDDEPEKEIDGEDGSNSGDHHDH